VRLSAYGILHSRVTSKTNVFAWPVRMSIVRQAGERFLFLWVLAHIKFMTLGQKEMTAGGNYEQENVFVKEKVRDDEKGEEKVVYGMRLLGRNEITGPEMSISRYQTKTRERDKEWAEEKVRKCVLSR